jgi:hypothetical protein
MTSSETKSGTSIPDQRHRDLEEILQFPARFLLDLPRKTILTLRHQTVEFPVIWTTFSVKKPRPADRTIVFDREELLALISASEAEKTRPKDLSIWCWLKQENPEFVLNEEIALCGVRVEKQRHWELRRLLNLFNLDLISLEIVDSVNGRGESVRRAA